METTKDATTKAARNLILMNNDRHEGYEKAAMQTADEDLKELFSSLSDYSKENSMALKLYVEDIDEDPVEGVTSSSGKLHQVWMDIKNALSANNRKSVLSSCAFGEEVIKEAYEISLAERDMLDNDAVQLIQKQYDKLLETYNRIKVLGESLV